MDLAYPGRLIAADGTTLAARSAGYGARGGALWWRAQWRRAGRAADHELGLEEQFLRVDRDALHLVDQQGDCGLAHRLDGLADGGQRRVGAVQPCGVVETDDRHVGGGRQGRPPPPPGRAAGEGVAAAGDGGGAVAETAAWRGLGAPP